MWVSAAQCPRLTRARCPRHVPFVDCVCPPGIVELQSLLVGLSIDDLMCGVVPTERELFWCHSGPLSGMLFVELLRWGSDGGQCWLGGISSLEPSWEGLQYGLVLASTCSGLGAALERLLMNQGILLLMLSLEKAVV